MAYICLQQKNSCSNCPYYRFDKERNRMACFAIVDEKEKNEAE